MALDPRTPVLAAWATVTVRPDQPAPPHALEMMVRAVRAAADDAGSAGAALVDAAQWLGVCQGAWRHANAPGWLAERLDIPYAHGVLAELGVPQLLLVHRAMDAIANGSLDVAIVVGGEALAHRDDRAAPSADPSAGAPDETIAYDRSLTSPLETVAGLVSAPSQYALVEERRRIVAGATPEAHIAAVARRWAAFSSVAETNPLAWNRTPMTAEAIATPGPRNRSIARPYTRWLCSQMNVDQSSAIVLCSLEAARRHGIADDQLVFPLATARSDHAVPIVQRDEPARCAAYSVVGRALTDATGIAIGDVDLFDLYSCFPVAVAVQCDELGVPADVVPTITGGMTFAGGPLNNYVITSITQMASALRARPGAVGLTTAVSGMLTKQGGSLWSTRPPASLVRPIDVTAEVANTTHRRTERASFDGAATIVTSTVLFGPHRLAPEVERGEPAVVVAVVEDAQGHRGVASSTDQAYVAEVAATPAFTGTVRVDGATLVG